LILAIADARRLMMTEKKTSLVGEVDARSLMNRIALALAEYPDDFADAKHLAWQAYALLALDEIAHTDPEELRLVLDWLMQTRNLPSLRLSLNNRTLQ
jgi:hypothetical protein